MTFLERRKEKREADPYEVARVFDTKMRCEVKSRLGNLELRMVPFKASVILWRCVHSSRTQEIARE